MTADVVAMQALVPRRTPISVIARLGAPLIAYNLVQNLTSLACLAVLGRLGDATLAGVGAAGAIYSVVLALLFGIDAGVQPIVSRAVGAGRGGRLSEALADAWAISLPLGAALAGLLWTTGPTVLAIILPDPAAAATGSAYLRALAPTLFFLSATIPINACWIGSGRPHLAFLVTLLLAPLQVALTVVLVTGWGPFAAQGAAGAGLANSLGTVAGIGLQFALAWGRIPGFLRAAPRPAGVAAVAAIGWPVSLQQALLQFGFMVSFVIVARLGTASTAAANVLVSLTLLPTQMAVGLGTAAATLVGQALGRGDPAEARRWGWRTSLATVALIVPLGLVVAAAPQHLLGLFLHDPRTVALAVAPARMLGATLGFYALAQVLFFAARGAGATKIASLVPFAIQWLVQIPLTWWIGVRLGLGLLGIVSIQAGLSIAEAVAFAWIWSGGAWTTARVGPADARDAPKVRS